MCPDSLRSQADAGWTRSPRSLPARVVTGCWASQSICSSGCSWPQLRRDRGVPLGVPEPDRRRQVQRPARTPGGAHPGGARRGPAGESWSTNSAIRWLVRTGSRAGGPCPAPSSSTSEPPVSSASRSPIACGRIRSSVPCTTVDRAGHLGAQRLQRLAHRAVAARAGRTTVSASVCGRDLVRPADAVLDLLRRVRLGEHPAEEEVDEVVVAAPQPVRCLLYFAHPSCGVERLVPAGRGRAAGSAPAGRRTGAIANSPSTRSGMLRGDVHGPRRAAGQRDQHGPVGVRSRPARPRCPRRTRSSLYAAAPSGRPDRPLPRPSNVTTR